MRLSLGSNISHCDLKSFQMSEIVFDGTVKFCERFVDRFSRTTDQMVQAARSGRQNIAEGSQVSGTSKKTELKLVSVARGSLEELLLDYEDFLRQRELKRWEKDSKEALFVRKLGKQEDRAYSTYKPYLETRSAEVCANILIHQANYLLDQQLKALETDFLEEGGFTERLYNSRRRKRGDG